MTGRPDAARRGTWDPRLYQIVALSALLAAGLTGFGFEVPPSHVVVTLASALAVQWLAPRLRWPFGRIVPLGAPMAPPSPPSFEWKSALISALSLCLLLRARHPAWMALAALIAVGSKFVLRVPRAHGDGYKHPCSY